MKSAIWKNMHLRNYFLEIGGPNQEMRVDRCSFYQNMTAISMFKL